MPKERLLHDPEKVKAALRDQAEDEAWIYNEHVAWLYRLSDAMIEQLIEPVVKYGVEPMPRPAIGMEAMDVRICGSYRLGKNAFGVDDQILLNANHIQLGKFEQAETLCHELFHLWQQRRGEHPVKPGKNHHNKEFVTRCNSIGLYPMPVSGYHWRPAGGIFVEFMAKFGITQPKAIEVPKGEKRNYWTPEKPKGRSTLSLWVCECEPPQKVRVGRDTLHARCTLCELDFKKVE